MTDLSRRSFALGLPAASLTAGMLMPSRPVLAQARGAAPRTVAPVAQIAVGRFTVTALADGHADMPFGYFTGRAPAEIEQAAASAFAAKPGGIRLVFNQYLIDDGERLILVDAGPAGAFGKTGQLFRALASIGVTPEAIDAVIVTHLHVDHTGGLVAGGRRNFPSAEIYADRRDVTHWTDPARRAAAPDFLRSSFDAAAELVRLYPRLQATDGEREIVRGASIVDLSGHTPGHIGVRVQDGSQSLLMVSDMLFHPAIHPVAADIGFVFEQDPVAARAMRARFFPRAAEEKALIAATHMPFPGIGRIVPDGQGLRWLPAEWALQG
jgi:glyoxylase-like metal-dependent hydrolase (beta-lactamase superfamily II)